jgi:hypothetical protein
MDQKYDNNFMTYSIRQVICQPSNRLLYRLNAYARLRHLHRKVLDPTPQ